MFSSKRTWWLTAVGVSANSSAALEAEMACGGFECP
jgi:hypothetical protein